MLRNALAGGMSLLAGIFGLLLLAAIVFSCRQNSDPHHRGESGYVHAPNPSTPQATHLSVRTVGPETIDVRFAPSTSGSADYSTDDYSTERGLPGGSMAAGRFGA